MRSLPVVLLLLAACHTQLPLESAPASQPVPEPVPMGWEGFFQPPVITQAWLDGQRIPLRTETLQAVAPRVVRLILDNGPQQASAEDLEGMQALYCETPEALAWNQARCQALTERSCDDEGDCSYHHFGSCSGFLLGDGVLLTAAHCLDAAVHDPTLAETTVALPSGPDSLPGAAMAITDVHLAKTDFAHHWVAIDDEHPVDFAWARVDDGGLEIHPIAPLPAEGQAVFITGHPRVEGRSPEDLATAGYALNPGLLTTSFGRLSDDNATDLPLCNPDGWQEHWQLQSPCPGGEVQVEGMDTWRGVITHSPALFTYDSINGYSGAPVFDDQGRLIAINVTLIGKTNPQEAYDPETRMVAIPVERVRGELGL